jgi:hypothetical protein
MKFNSEVFKRKAKCFRSAWQDDHFLTYDGENFVKHVGNVTCIWYWDSAEDFQKAIEDLLAEDWRYIE